MAVSLGSAVLTIGGDASGLNQALRQAEGITQGAMSKIAGHARTIGVSLTAVGAGITGALTLAVKEAIDFESAFAGVRKTMDGTEEEFAAINAQIRELSRTIPVSAEELAKIAEMGAQLGIRKENIIAFTRTIADMSVATDMTSEAAATMLAQFMNITRIDPSKISNLGAAIVELGNNGASTESQIAEMALRLAGAGTTAGLSAQDILGFSSALASLGIDAEAGGTAMSKVFIMLASSVDQGGKSLDQFAAVAGMTSAQFVQAFKNDPAQAIVAFVQGLGQVEQQGGSLFTVLESLGVQETRLRDTLLRASLAGNDMASSIKMSNSAFRENSALTDEATKRYATTASQLQLLKNDFMEFARTIGESLAPTLREIIGRFREIADNVIRWVTANPQLTQTIVMVAAAVGGIATVLGPLLILMPGVVATIAALSAAFFALATPIGVVAAAIGIVLAGALYYLYTHLEEAKVWVTQNWDRIVQVFNSAKEAIGTTMQILGQILRTAGSIISAVLAGFTGGVVNNLQEMADGSGKYSNDFLGTVQMVLDKVNEQLPKVEAWFKWLADWIDQHWQDIVDSVTWGVENVLRPLFIFGRDFLQFAGVIMDAASGVASALAKVFAWFGWSAPPITPPNIPHKATGGRAGGMTLVGERGPELVNLPRGSYVHTNQDSRNMMNGASVHFGNINISGVNDPEQIAREVMVRIERAVQNKFAKRGQRLATA